MDDQEFGYMKAKVEQNADDVRKLTELIEKHAKRVEEDTSDIKSCIRELRDEINTYKIVIRILKAAGWTALFVLAFKFGDIADLWKR